MDVHETSIHERIKARERPEKILDVGDNASKWADEIHHRSPNVQLSGHAFVAPLERKVIHKPYAKVVERPPLSGRF